MIGSVISWLNDPAHWHGTYAQRGIVAQLGSHLYYSVLALVIAGVIALPAGLWIGHYRRYTGLIAAANAVRALPTVGLLVLLAVCGNTANLVLARASFRWIEAPMLALRHRG